MASPAIYVNDCGIVTSLGRGVEANAATLFAGKNGMSEQQGYLPDAPVFVGKVLDDLPPLPETLKKYDSRNNRLIQIALTEIRPTIDGAITKYGRDRVAVILGTSTSGIDQGEAAYATHQATDAWPAGYDYRQQEASSPSLFVAEYLGITGPAYTIATACSSSAKVFASARRLIATGMVDAAIVGGADTLCGMTVNGFNALQILSPTQAKPFSANRDGITIGEAAAVFFLSREHAPVQLLGIGETADAYHITAPDPQGTGVTESMQAALDDAGLAPHDISYINLHGTATPLNDATESHAIANLFGTTPCGSTKGLTGHTLGASGACEAAFLWLTLNPKTNSGFLPPHAWDGVADPALPALNFVALNTPLPSMPLAMLSNSFGFGGSNVSIILGHAR